MKILSISPHTDDSEIGCGGTLHKYRRHGVDVRVISLSHMFNDRDLIAEFTAALKLLDVRDHQVYDFSARNFTIQRQEILDALIGENKTYKPDIVLIPMKTDTHQDHKVVVDEAQRAFKYTTLISYELPWNTQSSDLNLFNSINIRDLQAKTAAFLEYKSQTNRAYYDKTFFHSLARVRGIQGGYMYAEAFNIIRVNINGKAF